MLHPIAARRKIAFMAEFLGIPYIKIAACAIVPSFLHFFAVGTMVHFEALKQGLLGLPRESLPLAGKVFKERGLLVTPLVVIVYLLISGSSPFLAAYWGIIYSVSIGQIHKRSVPLLTAIFLSMPCVLFWTNPLTYALWTMVPWALAAVAALAWLYPRSELRAWLFGAGTTGLLTGLLIADVDPTMAAFFTNMAVIAAGIIYKESKMGFRDILDTLEWGTKNALAIGAACATVGFIVGATTLTGLGLKFASAVIQLATGVAVFIHGMDFMALTTLDGVTLFFTLVFTAFALSSAKIYVPFAFVYSPIILWMPRILDPTATFDYFQFITIVLGVVFLGSTIIGYFKAKSTVVERFLTGIAALCMLLHEHITSIVGVVIMIGIYTMQRRRVRRLAVVEKEAAA